MSEKKDKVMSVEKLRKVNNTYDLIDLLWLVKEGKIHLSKASKEIESYAKQYAKSILPEKLDKTQFEPFSARRMARIGWNNCIDQALKNIDGEN